MTAINKEGLLGQTKNCTIFQDFTPLTFLFFNDFHKYLAFLYFKFDKTFGPSSRMILRAPTIFTSNKDHLYRQIWTLSSSIPRHLHFIWFEISHFMKLFSRISVWTWHFQKILNWNRIPRKYNVSATEQCGESTTCSLK